MSASSSTSYIWHTGRFILFTCAVSWASVAVFYWAGLDVQSPWFTLFGMAYMLIPATVAALLQRCHHQEGIVGPLRVSMHINRWWAVALLTPAVLVALSLGLSLLVPGVSFDGSGEGLVQRYAATLSPEQLDTMRQQLEGTYARGGFVLLMLLQGFVAGCTLNALFAFGEELGWRGYMVHHLAGRPMWLAALFIGLVWGVWHAPLILQGYNYPQHPAAGAGMMVAFCMLLSPMMVYITLKARSVVASAVFHGTINALAGFPLTYLAGGSDLSNGLMGYAGFAGIAVITAGFFLFDRYVTREQLFTRPLGD